jgi:menaquinone-dependent protoporphyrinogen oxidase
MRVLVSAASRHGATEEIAERIGEVMRRAMTAPEHEITVLPPQQVRRVNGYDAYVLGSAVYMGHWITSALELIEHNADAFTGRPVWLFSSGPIGDPPKPDEQPVDVGQAVRVTGAREHRLFSGRLDKGELGFGERAIAVAFRAPEGDFRDWAAIERWAITIADSLTEVPA